MAQVVVFLATTLTFYIKMIYFLLIQVLVFCYTVFIRPYEEWKDNLIEALNDIIFIIVIVMLIMFESETDWNSTKKMVALNLMTLSGAIVSLVLVVDIIIKVVKKCRKCRKDRKLARLKMN